MKIEEVELRRIRMQLVSPFQTSFGIQTERDVLLVRVIGPDAEGWGECVALSEPAYSPEYVDGAEDVIRHHLLPRLFALADPAAHLVGPALADIDGHPMAKAVLEMAVLDAELRRRRRHGVGIWGRFATGGFGVSVGIAASVPQLLDAVGAYLDRGTCASNSRSSPAGTWPPSERSASGFGDVLLQVDANAAYTLADTRHLARLDPFDLLLIDQPLPADDLAGHAQLARGCGPRSAWTSRSPRPGLRPMPSPGGPVPVVNIKAGRVGGYLEARRIHDVCAAHGVPVWCGGMFETGLGRAANLALAALPNFTLPGRHLGLRPLLAGRYHHAVPPR